jgi:hypothetical protein
VSFEQVEPQLAIVDRWLVRREGSGPAVAGALEGLARRFLSRWARTASSASVGRARAMLAERGVSFVAEDFPLERDAAPQLATEGAERMLPPRATELLARITGAAGAEAYEVVEQSFRRSIARLGARFVAEHARAAIDDTMGPMHATVVAADLFSTLERLDAAYLEALTFALETMHDWGAVAGTNPEKNQAPRIRKARALSSPRRRA